MVDITSSCDSLWTYVLDDYDDQATVLSQVTKSKAPKDQLEEKSDGRDKKSKMKLGMSMHSKSPGLKALESKSPGAPSKVSEAVSSSLGDLKDAQEILLGYANKLGIDMEDLLNGRDKKSKINLGMSIQFPFSPTGMSIQSKAPGSKASESKSLAASLKVSEAMSSQLRDLKVDEDILLRYANKLEIDMEDLLNGRHKKSSGSKASESKSSVARSEVSEKKAKRGENSAIRIQSVVRGGIGRDMARVERREQSAIRLQSLHRGVIARDLIKSMKAIKETSAVRIQEILLRYANKLGIDMEDLLNGRDKKSSGSKASMKAKETSAVRIQSQQESEAKTTEKPDSFLATKELHVPTKSATKALCVTWVNGCKKSVFGWKRRKQRKAKRRENSAIRIQSVKTTEKPDSSLVTKELHVPTKSATKALSVTWANGSKKSVFGWKTKKQRKAKRRENSAIRIQSVVRGGIGREIARAERRKQSAIRLQSLRRGDIARDLIKLIKAKKASAVRIQRVARGSIVRNQVRTENIAATGSRRNHRGYYVVRRRQKMDKQKGQKVQQDQASDESECSFDKFFLMRSCTGLGTTKFIAPRGELPLLRALSF
jgi:hypothetical protein